MRLFHPERKEYISFWQYVLEFYRRFGPVSSLYQTSKRVPVNQLSVLITRFLFLLSSVAQSLDAINSISVLVL